MRIYFMLLLYCIMVILSPLCTSVTLYPCSAYQPPMGVGSTPISVSSLHFSLCSFVCTQTWYQTHHCNQFGLIGHFGLL